MSSLVEVDCSYCGKQLKIQPFRLVKFNRFFCDLKCLGSFNSMKSSIVVDCANCGIEITIAKSRANLYGHKFCGPECRSEWLSSRYQGNNNPRWKPKVEAFCATCNKKLEVYPCHSKQNNFCDAICSKLWKSVKFSGNGNPNWNDGSSYAPYGLEFNSALRNAVRERDGFCCQLCGSKEDDMAHSIHHIDYDKLNNDISNLITLCNKNGCHSKTNFNRKYWQKIFTKKVQEGPTTIPMGSTLQAYGSGSAEHPSRMMI